MPRLTWSQAALSDLVRLNNFLRPKNPEAAKRAIKAIRQSVKFARKHPEMGRPVTDVDSQCRELIVPFGHNGYVVRYLYQKDQLVILAVRHGREAGL